jgi:hypothetical protein
MTAGFNERNAVLQATGIGDLGDEAASVILPSILSGPPGVPYGEQRLQRDRQHSNLSHLGTFDQRGHESKFLADKRGDDLVADHVAFIVEPWQVVGVRPARADDDHADAAPCQCSVNLVPPLPNADALHVAKYSLAPKPNAQPVV